MLQTVEGIYKNGIIQLSEIPDKITESKVLITFIDSKKQKLRPNIIQFGMFSGINQSTEEDFKYAEFSENFDNN
jgi:hypothetical protein